MKNLLNKKTKKKGFTLIELIIVLAVMAIIAAIAIPSFSAVRNNAKTKADKQSCETIKRTVLTLVADETVTVTENVNVNAAIDATSKKMKATVAEGDVTKIAGVDKITEALIEVNAPQQKDKTSYSIEIDKDGTVTEVTVK